MGIELKAIGVVRTDAAALPRHWSVSDVEGTLIVDEEYADGLRDIEPGQRIVVIFTGRETGVFSASSPIRPNPVGPSVVEVLGIRGANIAVRGLDMLDGTPILDIKPHVEGRRG